MTGFEDEIEIEETQVGSPSLSGCDTVLLSNGTGVDVDAPRLRAELGRLAGAGGVRSLVVQPSSTLTDVRVVAAFPALETLELYGARLRSLDGLEAFAHGRYLKVDTGGNRDLSRLPSAPIARLWLRWAASGDLAAIAGCASLRELTLADCPPLALGHWARVPLESLTVSGGTLAELAGSASVPTLRRLVLDHCGELVRFSGDHEGITWMVVQGCDRLDFGSLRALPNLEFLAVASIARPLALSSFASLARLRRLTLERSDVVVDTLELPPALTELTITGLSDERLEALRSSNPGVAVS